MTELTTNPSTSSTQVVLGLAIAVVLAVGVPPLVLRATARRIGPFLARHSRGLTFANIVTQIGIIVTGGAVRLTGSGLGCSTWPECEPGSYTPVAVAATDFHQWIEFGNRLLTFILLAVAVLVAIALWHGQRHLRWWGLVPYIGVIAQAVLGGVTVLTDLSPLVVGAHLIVSAGLVWNAVWLWRRASGREFQGHHSLDVMRKASLLTLIPVVVLGVLVTGAGPHAGDAATPRLPLHPGEMSRIHSFSAWIFTATVAGLVFLVWKQGSRVPGLAMRSVMTLVAVTLAQIVIGYVQYFTGLPILIVGAHLLGLGVLVAVHAWVFDVLRAKK